MAEALHVASDGGKTGLCCMQKGARVIPAGADMYAQLVECPFLRDSAVSLKSVMHLHKPLTL